MVARRSGYTRQGKASGSGCPAQKSKRKKAKANRTQSYLSSTLSMARQSLFNAVAITAVSGAVLLALLAAQHF